MKRQEVFAVIVIVIIAVISIAFLFIGEPEDQRIEDGEGFVRLEGQWLDDVDIRIERVGGAEYELLPEYLYISGPMAIYFETEGVAPENIDVYHFDTSINMWERIESTVFSDTEIVIAVEALGRFMLMESPEISIPTFISQYDELLAMAPVNTVGYEIAVGMVSDSGDVLRIMGEGDVGGCGGAVGRGNITERSELENEVRVLVDDVETLVHFLFVGQWIVDESGCMEGIELRSVL